MPKVAVITPTYNRGDNGFLYSGIAFVGVALSVWGYAYSIVRRKTKKRKK